MAYCIFNPWIQIQFLDLKCTQGTDGHAMTIRAFPPSLGLTVSSKPSTMFLTHHVSAHPAVSHIGNPIRQLFQGGFLVVFYIQNTGLTEGSPHRAPSKLKHTTPGSFYWKYKESEPHLLIPMVWMARRNRWKQRTKSKPDSLKPTGHEMPSSPWAVRCIDQQATYRIKHEAMPNNK